ncbi:MAG TPA: O-antigen ligase family protein [Myxococcaceae bacterium]|nr:O-antigen ligase family protein [Myxococcaceae bacterium]
MAVVLVVWPWAASPFSGPKWLVTGVAAALFVALLGREMRPPSAVAVAAIAHLAGSLLSWLLVRGATPWWTLAGPALVAAWCLAAPPVPWGAVASAGGLAAGVVLLQALGLDPFGRFMPEADGQRLALYGTLGNPDFVASVLGVTVPVTIVATPRARRAGSALCAASLLVQVLALGLLRSFATVLALAVAATVVLVSRRPGQGRRWLALVLGAALLAAAVPLAGRSLATVLRGRWYLVTTAAPHVAEAPWLGQGPGTVVLHWPAWELERWRARCGADPACVAAHPDARFLGVQEHLHDDWLERLLETGVVGLLALVALFGTAFGAALRSGTLEGLGIASGLASLAARSTVDFPLQRPADLVLLALLCGAASRLGRRDFVDARHVLPGDSRVEGGMP